MRKPAFVSITDFEAEVARVAAEMGHIDATIQALEARKAEIEADPVYAAQAARMKEVADQLCETKGKRETYRRLFIRAGESSGLDDPHEALTPCEKREIVIEDPAALRAWALVNAPALLVLAPLSVLKTFFRAVDDTKTLREVFGDPPAFVRTRRTFNVKGDMTAWAPGDTSNQEA